MIVDPFPDGLLELPGFTQGGKTLFGDRIVNPLIPSRLIEDLHGPGCQKTFLCQVIEGVVQGAERECSPGHFGNFVPDSHPIGIIFDPPYGNEKNLLIDRQVFQFGPPSISLSYITI